MIVFVFIVYITTCFDQSNNFYPYNITLLIYLKK
jgi:hypothetical protein